MTTQASHGHGHAEPKAAWREVYLYDEKCACGCPLIACPDADCGLARCLHCQPPCADDALVLNRPPGVSDEEWRDLIGLVRVTVAIRAREAAEARG